MKSNTMPEKDPVINHIGKNVLEHRFNSFVADKTIPYIFVKIKTPIGFEVVVVPQRHAKEKREFYESAYSDELVHVMNGSVRIVDITMGDESALPRII